MQDTIDKFKQDQAAKLNVTAIEQLVMSELATMEQKLNALKNGHFEAPTSSKVNMDSQLAQLQELINATKTDLKVCYCISIIEYRPILMNWPIL